MHLDFTPAAERALQLAQRLARGDGNGTVRAADLLGALLEPDEGQAMALLHAAGLGLERVRQLFPPIVPDSSAADDVPLGNDVRAILDHARELARVHGAEETIGSDHLLLAILDADAELREILTAAGLDWRHLKNAIAPQAAPLPLDEAIDFSPITEAVDLARIADAAANRAREALRVLEDYARFALGDAFLTRTIKELRHRVAETLSPLPMESLLASRDTLGDVGTEIVTPREMDRESLAAVVLANAKRMQEALRSLEEFGKVHEPALGQALEPLRYQAYTIEKALIQTRNARVKFDGINLHVLVTESLCRASLVGTVSEVLAGGAHIIQLREKGLPDRDFLDKGRVVRELTRKAGALFIVNDRPDIALLAEADGVHLGQDDLPVRAARRLLGPDAVLGVSTHNLDQVRRAVLEGASYIGVGPTFPSQTKNFSNFAGLEFVRQVAAETTLPAFVLGGITLDNLPAVLEAGGKRIAVSQALCASEDPRALTMKLRALLDRAS